MICLLHFLLGLDFRRLFFLLEFRFAAFELKTRGTRGSTANSERRWMRKVIGAAFVSLDGVMQAPGGPEEDPTGDFALGGWLPHFADEEIGQRIGALFDQPFDLLLGRRTYEIFAAYWPFVTGEEKGSAEDREIGQKFDRAAKFVLTHGDQPLDWQNSHRLATLDALAQVKRSAGPNLIIQGSSTLYPLLLTAGLIDQLILMTFPVILGRGKRLFGDATPSRSLRMVEHRVTQGGNIIATYEPNGDVQTGSFLTIEPSTSELVRRKRMAEGSW
jgi:dihydrofolate reductase